MTFFPAIWVAVGLLVMLLVRKVEGPQPVFAWIVGIVIWPAALMFVVIYDLHWFDWLNKKL